MLDDGIDVGNEMSPEYHHAFLQFEYAIPENLLLFVAYGNSKYYSA